MERLWKILFIWASFLFLLSCTTTSYDSFCPVYPVAGENVAKELESIPYEQAPNFWEHQARLYKLKQELDLCK